MRASCCLSTVCRCLPAARGDPRGICVCLCVRFVRLCVIFAQNFAYTHTRASTMRYNDVPMPVTVEFTAQRARERAKDANHFSSSLEWHHSNYNVRFGSLAAIGCVCWLVLVVCSRAEESNSAQRALQTWHTQHAERRFMQYVRA